MNISNNINSKLFIDTIKQGTSACYLQMLQTQHGQTEYHGSV